MSFRTRIIAAAIIQTVCIAVLLYFALTTLIEDGQEGAAWIVAVAGLASLVVTWWSAIAQVVSVLSPVRELSEAAREIAAGSGAGRLSTVTLHEFAPLCVALREVNDMLTDAQQRLSEVSDSLDGNSRELHRVAHEVSEFSVEIEGRAANNATASEQMSVTIENVARNAQDASEGATDARRLTEDGRSALSKTLDEVHRAGAATSQAGKLVDALNEYSAKIGAVVRFIGDIADETNLLALNAAIEAARAGEHGRGFAVVADEVRKLAEATMKSTKEIADIVESIQSGTSRAQEAMGQVGTAMQGVTARARQTSDVLAKIEQANRGIEQMVLAISTAAAEQSTTSADMARNIEVTAETAEKLSASGRELPRVAQGMVDLSERLTEAVNGRTESRSRSRSRSR